MQGSDPPFSIGQLLTTFVPALLGFIGGVIGSIVAPWIHWGVEKRKLKLAARQELIVKARRVVAGDLDKFAFRETPTYSTLRPLLSERTRKEIESDAITIQRSGRGSGEHSGPRHYARLVLDDLQRLEIKWKLL
jgi:hypothetical protein